MAAESGRSAIRRRIRSAKRSRVFRSTSRKTRAWRSSSISCAARASRCNHRPKSLRAPSWASKSARRPAERGEPIETATLNLLSGANVRSIGLQSISNLSLDDPQLEEELTKALAALVQARDQDKKPVTINFSGVGDRRVRIGYVVETPIWKTSYRLLLEDKGTPSKLQGWAIVENQTESDWNGVSLSLVSGRPMSFMMDLYQPLYAVRPTVVPEMFAGLLPQVYDGATPKDKVRVAMLAALGGAGARGNAAKGRQRTREPPGRRSAE